MATFMHSNTQILFDQLATLGVRAHLGCVGGVDQYHRPPSLFRFAGRVLYQLCPGNIRDAFAHPSPFTCSHLLRLKFLKRDHLVGVDQVSAALVGKILAAESDSLVDTSKCLLATPVLIPLLGVFRRVLELLKALQVGFIAPEKAWVLNFLAL